MKIDGRCHCGAISYEATVNPEKALICHCTDCQTISGAPYRAIIPVRIENFDLRGQPKTYLKTADSGQEIVTTFCGNCGSAMYSSKLQNPTHLNLRLGAVKQRRDLSPKYQGFCGSSMPWAMDITTIPRVPEPPSIIVIGAT